MSSRRCWHAMDMGVLPLLLGVSSFTFFEIRYLNNVREDAHTRGTAITQATGDLFCAGQGNALDNFPVPAVARDEDGRRAIVDRDPGVRASLAEVFDDIEVAVLHGCRERGAPVNHLAQGGMEGRVTTVQLRGRVARESRGIPACRARNADARAMLMARLAHRVDVKIAILFVLQDLLHITQLAIEACCVELESEVIRCRHADPVRSEPMPPRQDRACTSSVGTPRGCERFTLASSG